jgi:ankyrin repeat protein
MSKWTSKSLWVACVLVAGCAPVEASRTSTRAAPPAAPAAPAPAATRPADPRDLSKRDPKAALIWAVAGHRADEAMRLIRDGADVNYTLEWDPSTALWLAAGSARMSDVAKALVAAGADVNRAGLGGMPPVQNAIAGRSPDVARLLIEAGADVRAKDCTGFTALHHAARVGDGRTCKLLLDRGADVNEPDKWGCTPLDVARAEGRADVVAFLEGADAREAVAYDGRRTLALPSATEPDRPRQGPSSPLHNAVVLESSGLAWQALRRGADVNARDDAGYTPLHIAAYGREPYVEEPFLSAMLVKHGADVNAVDAKGRTPLDIALWRRHDLTAAVLRESGAKRATELAAGTR